MPSESIQVGPTGHTEVRNDGAVGIESRAGLQKGWREGINMHQELPTTSLYAAQELLISLIQSLVENSWDENIGHACVK